MMSSLALDERLISTLRSTHAEEEVCMGNARVHNIGVELECFGEHRIASQPLVMRGVRAAYHPSAYQSVADTQTTTWI